MDCVLSEVFDRFTGFLGGREKWKSEEKNTGQETQGREKYRGGDRLINKKLLNTYCV